MPMVVERSLNLYNGIIEVWLGHAGEGSKIGLAGRENDGSRRKGKARDER